MSEKKFDLIWFGYQDWFINFWTVDGRSWRMHYSTLCNAMRNCWWDFEYHLGNALWCADAKDSHIIIDAFGWLVKRMIEEEILPRRPDLIEEKDQD